MSPEQITAVCGGLVAVLGAILGYLSARQGRRMAELEARVGHLEDELAQSKSSFREAVRFIRTLLSHIVDLGIAHRLGTTEPAAPPIPERLREEV
ncbi:MAG: hypothetical protein JWN03_1199 [Nocardia sp.]|uniref:hypothetical protein n=1 Tax=Nocardia sp. TaxID=1821 RepID=UPI0026137A5A|nr:hypothetical protein [Nocardia sp.]MCU1640924.1 hypothetical protein [Nocardia sp.]